MKRFVFPENGISVDRKATILAIDDILLPYRGDVCCYMNRPVCRKEPVLAPTDRPKAPDSAAAHFYGTVLQDGGRFRMWYYAVSRREGYHDGLREGPVCYAESEDGIHWEKPVLGQVEFEGSRENNALKLSETTTEGAFVIRDEEDPDPSRRYKMVFEEMPPHRKWYSINMATSPDGIHWTPFAKQPICMGLEPCSFYRFGGKYIINAQRVPAFSEGGHKAGRQGHAWISYDFDHWLQEPVTSFTLPEAVDPKERGLDREYLQVHLGTAGFSYGNAMVGLYCRWNARPKPGDWFGRGTTFGDWGISVSHDGLHFHEPVKGHVFLSAKENPATPAPGVESATVLCQANGILNVGDETRIYHGRWRNAPTFEHYYGEVALATLPRDRWGAVGLPPEVQEGAAWTAAVTLPEGGCEVCLNGDGLRNIRVEIADERFRLIDAFSGERCGRTAHDGLCEAVAFPEGSLERLGGATVRLRLTLLQGAPAPRLYAVYLK